MEAKLYAIHPKTGKNIIIRGIIANGKFTSNTGNTVLEITKEVAKCIKIKNWKGKYERYL